MTTTISMTFGTYEIPATIAPVNIAGGMRIAAADKAVGHGSVNTTILKEQAIQFRGMITGTSADDLRTNLDALKAALSAGAQYLTFFDDKKILAAKRSFRTDYDPTSLSRYCTVEFELVCTTGEWEAV